MRPTIIALYQFDTYNTLNAAVNGVTIENMYHGAWLQLADDGTYVTGSVSLNGYDFIELWNESRTAFMAGGIDQIGFGGSSGVSSTGNLATIHISSWIVE
jgi:hypothetical protein